MKRDDSLEVLQKRLEDLPTDLEMYFKHSMGSIDDPCSQQAAKTLLLLTEAETPVPILLLCDKFHQKKERAAPRSQVAPRHRSHDDQAAAEDWGPLIAQLRKCLEAESRDLVHTFMMPTLDGPSPWDVRVGFLHRSELLQKPS